MRFFLLYSLFILSLAAQPVLSPAQEANSSPVTLSEKVKLSFIHVHGNKRTRKSIMLREMNVREGDIIAADSINYLIQLNRKRLINLNLFTDVQIITDTVSSNEVYWIMTVKEQWYIWPELSFKLADRNFNVWWVEQKRDPRRANIGVTLKDRNFRGNMEQLGATAQVGYTQKFGLDYYRPYVDKKQRHGIGASFFASKNEETWYITDSNKLLFVKVPGKYISNTFDAGVQYTYRPGYAYRHRVELRYRRVDVNDTVVKLNPNYFLGGGTRLRLLEVFYRFYVNKVDNWNYPLTGIKALATANTKFGLEGMNYQSMFWLEMANFRKLGRKWYSSHIFRGRIAFPGKQPYIYSYALGNNTEYVRGYEYYVIDGSHYGLLRTNLKYELLNVSMRNIPLRYLPVIPFRIYPKIFADVGAAHNKYPRNSFLNDRLLYSAGAGVDILTAYDMKIRLEYAINHLGEKGLFLHIESE
jgi:outer membrane protein assembly factor BamA